ncbi:MAG: SDR family NAD(P)-dependent oxidoreductase [Clostridiales bacterium]|nr:SDR family NAD(P)-dependent oxidoreductase [Clostridiales bacterium]
MNIAIVTGASSGIGEEILRALVSERGAFGSLPFGQIWAIARNSERLELLRQELGSSLIRVFALDLTAPQSRDLLSETLAEETPTVGLLVNCAGIGRVGPVLEQTIAHQRDMIALNCSVPAELTAVCLPYMTEAGKNSDFRNGPRILNIASSAAFLPQAGFATYAATKSFLLSFSRATNAELKPYNISSTTVCPGPVSTDFLAHATGKTSASFSGIKSLFIVRPDKLAKSSIRAARKGRSMLVYGFSQKVLHVASKLLPTRFLMFLSSRLTGSNKHTGNAVTATIPSYKIDPVSTTVLLPFGNGKRTGDDVKISNKQDLASAQSTTASVSVLPPTTSAQALEILRAYPGKASL